MNPEKNPWSKDENQQQTQPTCDTGTGNQTRATLVGGECSHHCAIPAPVLLTTCTFTNYLIMMSWESFLKSLCEF